MHCCFGLGATNGVRQLRRLSYIASAIRSNGSIGFKQIGRNYSVTPTLGCTDARFGSSQSSHASKIASKEFEQSDQFVVEVINCFASWAVFKFAIRLVAKSFIEMRCLVFARCKPSETALPFFCGLFCKTHQLSTKTLPLFIFSHPQITDLQPFGYIVRPPDQPATTVSFSSKV